MNLLRVLAVVVYIVAGCAGSPPTASQPMPASSPIDTLAPSPTATVSAAPTAMPSATATDTPSGQASPESMVYPIADGEEWILFDGVATDPGEPGPHDALYLIRPDGTGLHRLVYQMDGSEVRATWSPDGSQVAYIQTRWPLDSGPGAGIYVVNADGTDPHRVYECADWCNTTDYLDWGADGAIYVGIDSNVPDLDSPPLTFEIWRIDPVSGDARAVLTREDGEMTVEQPRVSPDGTQLVYTRGRMDEKTAIFIADMAGGAEQQLTDWELNASYPDWSVNGLISFNTNDLRLRPDEPHWVYIMRPDGSGLRRIETHDPDAPDVEVQAGHARWTPDGTAVTFSLLLRGQAYLALMNADGSDQRLVPGPVRGTFSELRPVTHGAGSGLWILYQYYDVAQAAPDLGLIRTDGTDNHRVPGGPGNRWHPDWSPDGTQIAYDWATPANVAEIAIVDLDGSDERSLLECVDPCYGNGGPAWSPDGRSIGFDGAEGPTPQHDGDLCYLAILDLDSGEATRFLEHEDCSYADSYLRFSPDGERVVFQRQGPGGLAIFTATIEGQEELQVTQWGLGARPDWSPDGEWIVFMSVEPESHPGQAISLHRVRPDGTDLEQLTNPTGTTIDLYPRWLPDGSGIIFSRCPVSEAPNCETRTIAPDGSEDRLLLAPFAQHAVHVMWQPSTER